MLSLYKNRDENKEGNLVRLAIITIFVASLVLTLGCNPIPRGQQPDDVVTTPGGPAYRANVHQQGVRDLWPSIETSVVVLGDNVTVHYRASIVTVAGQTRKNIVAVRKAGVQENLALKLSVSNIPAGFKVTEGEKGDGLPGTSVQVLVIEIPYVVTPGEYTFDIGVEYDGKDYGKIPCTVKVIVA